MQQKKVLEEDYQLYLVTLKKKKSESNQIQTNKIPIADLQRNKYQPRTLFDEEKLNELSLSIKENGIIQPVAVRPNKYEPGKFEIVAGERRWLAAQKAGLNEVPAIVLDIDDQKSLEIAIVENVQREDLSVIEEAKAYQRLVKEFGYDHEKISKFMSKSRSHVSNTIRLLTLPEDIIGLIEEGKLTAGQARPLIGMPNASEIAENIVKKKVTAREIESLVKRKKNKTSTERIEDPNLTFVRNEIESKLGLNIEIVNKKNNSGKIIIKYKSLDQFELVSRMLRK